MTKADDMSKRLFKPIRAGWKAPLCQAMALLCLASGLVMAPALAQETVCARVKIEIKQELTLERQAFDAQMKINNTTDTGVIENVKVVVKVTDESGVPVLISSDPNDLSAKFYVRISSKENISDVDGSGTVNAKTTSTIDWLLIPAPGAAGNNPLGKKYLVGATLSYKYGGETQTMDVSPDVITVKPLPLLTLDYFLTQDVWADDPLTAEVEPVEPFTLGVRVKNNGLATAKNLKIDSAQPKIIENKQGLLINFTLTGSYVNDAPTQNTLLIDFGDIAASTSKMGRWNMETTLAGKFTEFTARFTHADELGGAMTSILQATNAHFLLRDVRVDLTGRDLVRDFLAKDGDVIRVYESDGPDTEVTDRSAVATLTPTTGSNGNATYRLSFPATAGFAYVRLPDPYNGTKVLGKIIRSDAKQLASENVWLSKTRNEQSKQWEYWVNFFDVNSTGLYDSEFQAPPAIARPPVIQFIPEYTVKEGLQVSFLVEASSPDGRAVSLAAAPLPAGATFVQQAADLAAPGLKRAVFDWTPAKGTAGTYPITYTATDGLLTASRTAAIKVESNTPPVGPGTPSIVAPLSGAQVTALKPTILVQTSTNSQDPTTQVQFELYSDEALTKPVSSSVVTKAVSGADGKPAPTGWSLATALADNTRYWWRARAFDGKLYSPWVSGQFFVNTFNDPPNAFSLLSPRPAGGINMVNPQLSWANTQDKDGDRITYSTFIYVDGALNTLLTSAAGLPDGVNGVASWAIDKPLTEGATYYWRVVARDSNGAETSTVARPFVVTSNQPPSLPSIVSPGDGAMVTSTTATMLLANASDPEGDSISYEFELDADSGFASAAKRVSGTVPQGSNGQTQWSATKLLENTWYYWRARAFDSNGDAGWRAGKFFVSSVNDAPALPGVANPGPGAWVATAYPILTVNSAIDPEGDVVRYQFQLGTHPSEGGVLYNGNESKPDWQVTSALSSGTTYWWRYRVADALGATSAWSVWFAFTVNTQGEQGPSLQITEPAVPLVPTTVGARRIASLRWEAGNLTEDANVSLYFGTAANAATGTRIVEGLRQAVGTKTGSYDWDVTDLVAGTYYVYGQIYTSKLSSRTIAPGAVVIRPAVPAGRIQVGGGSGATDELGKIWKIQVRLANAPIADVIVPIASSNQAEGVAQPAKLTFTVQNWSVYQPVMVTGVNDCLRDANQKYWISIGKAQSLDPNYIDVSGTSVPMLNIDNGALTGCVK